ncbi:MAG: hypothetical protein HP491_13085 [Nitrospira sp.]|nr:hypothetical protein [Nitrospira sp.]MBH0183941.1 hypothetical protein [Nitrospira sp.]
MKNQVTVQQYCRALLVCVFVCGLVLWQGGLSDASAGAIYSYIDDKGNAVYTDKLETIPEKYRAKVKVQQLSDPESKVSSTFQSIQQTIKDRVKAIGSKGTSGAPDLNVRNLGQETILNYAGAAAVFLLLVMYFSKNSPMIRLLALGLLFVLGVGTPVLIYTSAGGSLDVMKEKVTVTGQAQQNRLHQAP